MQVRQQGWSLWSWGGRRNGVLRRGHPCTPLFLPHPTPLAPSPIPMPRAPPFPPPPPCRHLREAVQQGLLAARTKTRQVSGVCGVWRTGGGAGCVVLGRVGGGPGKPHVHGGRVHPRPTCFCPAQTAGLPTSSSSYPLARSHRCATPSSALCHSIPTHFPHNPSPPLKVWLAASSSFRRSMSLRSSRVCNSGSSSGRMKVQDIHSSDVTTAAGVA